MATRRLFRRRSLNGAVVDVQTRLSILETKPARTSLLSNAVTPSNIYGGGIGFTWLEPYLLQQLNETITQAQEGAVAASGVTMTYKLSSDPTTVRTITKHKLTLKVATITTSVPHGYMIGSSVTLNYTPDNATFEGQHLVTKVPTATTFEFVLPDAISDIPETVVTTGQVSLNVRNGDFWMNPANGNATYIWDDQATPPAWVASDIVNGKGDETATKSYSTTLRPNSITETISYVVVSKGDVTVTATAHPFKDGDRLTISGFSGLFVAANGNPVYVASYDTNTFTYKIKDTTVSASGSVTGVTAKYKLIDNDIWTDKSGVTWLWSTAANDFIKKQDTASGAGAQIYRSSIDPSLAINLSSYSASDGTATFTLAAQHTFNISSNVIITCTNIPELSNTYTVTSVPSPGGTSGHGTTFQVKGEIEDSSGSLIGTAQLELSDGDQWIDPTNNNYTQSWSAEAGIWVPSDSLVNTSESESAIRRYQIASDPTTASWTIDRAFVSKGSVSLTMLTTTTLKLGDRINVSGTGGGGVANSTKAIISNFTSSSSFKYEISDATKSTPVGGVSGGTVTYRVLEGDEWIHPTTSETKVWRSGAWVLITDPAATAAQATATAAQATANGKNKVYYSSTQPDGNAAAPADAKTATGTTLTGAANTQGDIWFQFISDIIVGQWQGQGGTTWKRTGIGSLTVANIDAGKITAGSLSAGQYIRAKTLSALSGVELDADTGSLRFINNSGTVFGAMSPTTAFASPVGTGVTITSGSTIDPSASIVLSADSGGLLYLSSQQTSGSGFAEITLDATLLGGSLLLSGYINNFDTYSRNTAPDNTGERFVKVDASGNFFSIDGSSVTWSGGTVPNFSNFQAGLRSGNITIGTSTLGTRRIQAVTGDLAIGATASTNSFLLENLPTGIGQSSGGFFLGQDSGSDRVIRRRLGFSSGTTTDVPPSLSWTPSTGDIYLIHEA